MNKSAVFVGALLAAAGAALVIERGGGIAWLALLGGVALLLKAWRWPSSRDVWVGIALAGLLALGWYLVLRWVYSTWESGEVVELTVDTSLGEQTARLWVMDIDDVPVVYCDAEPALAKALLAGSTVQLTRGATVSTYTPRAHVADELGEDEAARVLEAMQVKYGARNNAAYVYYALLGRERDRVGLVAYLDSAESL